MLIDIDDHVDCACYRRAAICLVDLDVRSRLSGFNAIGAYPYLSERENPRKRADIRRKRNEDKPSPQPLVLPVHVGVQFRLVV